MRNLFFTISLLFSTSILLGQFGGCSNRINTVTFSPVTGSNDISLSINSDCCEVHSLESYDYITNEPIHTVTLCYLDTGLLLQTNITSEIILPNANTTGIQNFTINSYYHFFSSNSGCSANTVFNAPITLSIVAPLSASRLFTLANNEFNTIKLNVNPNPNTGLFSINLPTNDIQVNVTVFDLSGKKVYTNSAYSGNMIDVRNLSKGMYFAKVVSNETNEIIKFVIR